MKFLIISILILGCMMSCSVALKNDVCGLPHSIETDLAFIIKCRRYERRYYYDSENKMCVFFIYGGCGGNDNIFNNEEECKEKCVE